MIGDLFDDGEIVADEHCRESQLLLQLPEQFQHVGLDRHIECTGGFGGDQHGRAQRQGPGQGDALTLAAREFVWPAVGESAG